LIDLGIVLAVLVFIVSFVRTPHLVVKLAGAPLQVLPTLLGITPLITQQEVRPIDLYERSVIVLLTRPGNYAIYSDDQQVLLRTGMMEEATGMSRTWVSIKTVESGEAVPGSYIARGAAPWDPLIVPGRPLMTFVIAEPGRYEIEYPPQSGTVSFAPDYTTGREAIILLTWAAQIVTVTLIVVLLSLPRIRRRRQAQRQLDQVLDRKRAAAEAFWQDKLRDQPKRE
jgi:hypothetical protein